MVTTQILLLLALSGAVAEKPAEAPITGHGDYNFGDQIPSPWPGDPFLLSPDRSCMSVDLPAYAGVEPDLGEVCYYGTTLGTIALYLDLQRYDVVVEAASALYGPPRITTSPSMKRPEYAWQRGPVVVSIYTHHTVIGWRCALQFDNLDHQKPPDNPVDILRIPMQTSGNERR
jgi:hypothetical protein